MTSEPCSMALLVEAQRDGRLAARDVASLERHLSSCASCTALAQRLARIADHVREPSTPPSPLAHQRGRLALLRAATLGKPLASSSPAGHLAAALAIAVLGTLAAGVLRRSPPAAPAVPLLQHLPAIPQPSEPQAEAMLSPSPGARFERMETTAGVERVHLTDGALDLEVSRLPPGSRFLVTTADAEVEVHGTVFRVEASEGRLDRVSVSRGKVEVRHLGASTFVPAGSVWIRPAVTLPRVPQPAAPKERKGEASKSFAEGVALIERGDYATAADKLDAFRRANPGDGRAEDAAYLTILALQRAGRPASAADAARRFLALYPGSARRGAVQKVLDNP